MKLVFFVSIFGVEQLLQMRTITKSSGRGSLCPAIKDNQYETFTVKLNMDILEVVSLLKRKRSPVYEITNKLIK